MRIYMYHTQSKYDWLFNTQSKALEGDWLTLERNEKATLNMKMPYLSSEYKIIMM